MQQGASFGIIRDSTLISNRVTLMTRTELEKLSGVLAYHQNLANRSNDQKLARLHRLVVEQLGPICKHAEEHLSVLGGKERGWNQQREQRGQ
jgi:hypothetical protein